MKYQTQAGEILKGRGYADIVDLLNQEKLTPAPSRKAYRKAAADRITALTGVEAIDTESDKGFVQSLVRAGLLIRL